MAKVGGEEATASILDSVDPIFAAIEGHRIADAALVRAKSDNELDRCGDISWERYEARVLHDSKAGCAALLRYVDEHEANYGVGLFGEYDDPMKSAVNASCHALRQRSRAYSRAEKRRLHLALDERVIIRVFGALCAASDCPRLRFHHGTIEPVKRNGG